jgi:hypothetical protein
MSKDNNARSSSPEGGIANKKIGQLRQSAEALFAHELEALAAEDKHTRPANWRLSPRAVVDYLMGGKTKKGVEISPKYIGNRRLIETAVATLATDRALLLLGIPGTAKSWVSEHLAAAISGSSQLLVQCTAGTDENQIRYGWNYAQLLAKGPSREALVPTPLMRAMEDGKIVRFEELTRMGSDTQDTLITVLSEKTLPIPELNGAVNATRGFNMIATANNRDKGVNELSSAASWATCAMNAPIAAISVTIPKVRVPSPWSHFSVSVAKDPSQKQLRAPVLHSSCENPQL